jgi:hypothetical protein
MIPQTDFILVRGPRTDDNGNSIQISVSIQRNDGKFDLTNYSLLRMRPDTKGPMEEWVPTKELDLYKKAFGVEE